MGKKSGKGKAKKAARKAQQAASSSSGQTVQELGALAQDALERFDFDMALQYLQQAIAQEPQNTAVIDALAEVYFETGQAVEAHALLTQSIQLKPNENPTKYMYMGQLTEGKHALNCFQRGVDLMTAELSVLERQGGADQALMAGIRRQIATAIVAQSDLYLTDLCEEPNAEEECERLIASALLVDTENAEALQAQASMRISQCRPDDAVQAMHASVNLYIPPGSDTQEPPPEILEKYPPLQVRISGAKICIELEQDALAVKILETVIREDDENPEYWYFLGLAHSNLKYWSRAEESLTQALSLLEQQRDQADQSAFTLVSDLLDKVRSSEEPDAEQDDDDAMDEDGMDT